MEEQRLAEIERKLDEILSRLPQPVSHDNALAIHKARGGSVKTYLQGLNEQNKIKQRRATK